MARFLIAWECGEGLGHIIPIAQVATHLISRGHRVDVVLADMSSGRIAFGALLDSPALSLWQAPTWRLALVGSRAPLSLVELLFQVGFLDAQRLSMLVRGWLSIIRAVGPDAILVEHAPTALLAARVARVPTLVFGPGFFIPPKTQPIPSFAEWLPLDVARINEGERVFVATCNAVLQELDGQPIKSASELWSTSQCLLTTLPELDHYGKFRDGDARYIGFPALPLGGGHPAWPRGDAFHVAVYLKAGYAQALEVLKSLVTMKLATVAFVPGILPGDQRALACETLCISEQPLDMAAVMQESNLFITNGGAGVTGAAVRAGVPLLVLPTQAEQFITARRVVALKVGLALLEEEVADQIKAAVQRIQSEPQFRDNARKLMRHALLNNGEQACHRIADAAVALVGGPSVTSC
ncbi:glycosyltransferase [Niveibacterium sp. 24ML]|uniref:glycosyltransferase n=1 Tax=Niveibacterium sp. 24ML TaxID=2985512 RepID=UPI00226EA9FA|nr:nucleotide disphospho-sugar-binding domain-containing protein [Niveibacterium sp. 24ML]MCX9158054.1 glycosyltransferase [Niveibacterium sp. 24ML]